MALNPNLLDTEFATSGFMRSPLGNGLFIEFDPSELRYIVRDALGNAVDSGLFTAFLHDTAQ